MSEKHYCMDCIHCREALDVKISSAPSYWCKLEDDLVENYGDRRLSKYKKKVLCSEKNADGTCPDFEDRKLPEIPPPPPWPPAADVMEIEPDSDWDEFPKTYADGLTFPRDAPDRKIREHDFGPYCLNCGSSFKRKWLGFGRVLGCIQPECWNFYGGKAHKLQPKDTRLTEGMVRKGGKGSKPEGPPPPPPKGQRP